MSIELNEQSMLTEIGLQATEFLKKSKAKTLLPVHFLAALLQFDYIKNLLNNKKPEEYKKLVEDF